MAQIIVAIVFTLLYSLISHFIGFEGTVFIALASILANVTLKK